MGDYRSRVYELTGSLQHHTRAQWLYTAVLYEHGECEEHTLEKGGPRGTEAVEGGWGLLRCEYTTGMLHHAAVFWQHDQTAPDRSQSKVEQPNARINR